MQIGGADAAAGGGVAVGQTRIVGRMWGCLGRTWDGTEPVVERPQARGLVLSCVGWAAVRGTGPRLLLLIAGRPILVVGRHVGCGLLAQCSELLLLLRALALLGARLGEDGFGR